MINDGVMDDETALLVGNSELEEKLHVANGKIARLILMLKVINPFSDYEDGVAYCLWCGNGKYHAADCSYKINLDK